MRTTKSRVSQRTKTREKNVFQKRKKINATEKER